MMGRGTGDTQTIREKKFTATHRWGPSRGDWADRLLFAPEVLLELLSCGLPDEGVVEVCGAAALATEEVAVAMLIVTDV